MGFTPSGLRDAFEGQGEAGFIAYSYTCHDRLGDVMAPGGASAGRADTSSGRGRSVLTYHE